MRKYLLFFFLIFLITGCGSGEEPLPTVAAPADTQLRELPTPTPPLPPTWTPAPITSGQHIPGVGSQPVAATPGSPVVPGENQTTYTVQRGDTLGEIATQFGVTLDDLVKANNIADINRIEVGTVLIIP